MHYTTLFCGTSQIYLEQQADDDVLTSACPPEKDHTGLRALPMMLILDCACVLACTAEHVDYHNYL
jgi:hypothetical protein